MLIRTQNRNGLIDIAGMAIRIDLQDKNKIIAYSNHCAVDGWEVLAKYSSNEKAMKVLDMIQDTYMEGSEWLTAAGKVFNMPEDSEVDV